MALTEKVRLRLESKGFDKLFEEHQADWEAACNDARNVMKSRIENGEPTVDDIKQVLRPLIELDKHFRGFMQKNSKLTQLYWCADFTDYILHRVYQPTLHVKH